MSEVSVAFGTFIADLTPYLITILGLVLGVVGIVLLFKFGTKWFRKATSQ